MGKHDLYPFKIPEPVARKLDFVHRVVSASRVEHPLASAMARSADLHGRRVVARRTVGDLTLDGTGLRALRVERPDEQLVVAR